MYSLYFNAMKVLVDAAVHYEDAQITRYDNELGSVKRSRLERFFARFHWMSETTLKK
jgi:hypothetical protein